MNGRLREGIRRGPVSAPALLARRAFFTLLAAGITTYLTVTADTSELAELMPLFGCAIFVELVPLLWTWRPDPFAPPCEQGLMTAQALIASLAAFNARGSWFIRLLPQLSSYARTELIRDVLIATILGRLAYYAGYYHRSGIRFVRFFPRVDKGPWNRRRLLLASLVCLAIFLPAYVYFQRRVGTQILDLTAIGAGKRVMRSDPTTSWIWRSVLLGFVPICFLFAQAASRRRLRSVIVISLIAGVYCILVTRLGQRGFFAYFGLLLLALVHYLYRRVSVSLLAALFIPALIVVNALGTLRTFGAQAGERELHRQSWNLGRTFVQYGEDRERMDGLAYAFYAFPSRRDYLLGESYAALLVEPIPRWLWPEKAEYFRNRDTGIIYEATGVPAPMPFDGVLYVNFSWIGLVLGMALWGRFHRALYEWFLSTECERGAAILYGFTLMFFNPTILAIVASINFLIPGYLILRFIERRGSPRGTKAAFASPPLRHGGMAH